VSLPSGKPLIVAHRGCSGAAPENTLAAFRLAVASGADMIELDVRMSRDGRLMVIHDRRVDRTTNGSGSVFRKSAADLQALDAGSWYARRFTGERIPALQEVFHLLPCRIGLNIEVKTDGDRRRSELLARELGRLIRKKSRGRQVLVSSFDHHFLLKFHLLHPSVPTGALYLAVRDFGKRPSHIARRIGAHAFICSRAQVRKRFVTDAHTHRMVVAVYGVNRRSQLARMLELGVDAVITDHPGEMMRLLIGR
jgi:glycerophosphoryl diester phosphodiesterase